MYIGQLPSALRNIPDDGRTTQQIIATLEAKNVAVFQKELFANSTEPIPPAGTVYNFLATVCRELPEDVRKKTQLVFPAICRERGDLRKPTLRSALLLMERMTETRLFADTLVMNDPVLNPDSGHQVLISLGCEHEEGQPWVAAVAADCQLDDDCDGESVFVFLGPSC